MSMLKGLSMVSTGSLLETAVIAGAWAVIPTLGMLAWYMLKMLRLWTYFRTSVHIPEFGGRRNEENDTFKQLTHWLSEYLTERGKAGHDLDGTSVFSRNGDTVWSVAEEQVPRYVVFNGRQLWITLHAPTSSANSYSQQRYYTITVFGLRHSGGYPWLPGPQERVVREFFEECRRAWTEKEKKRTRIFVADAPNQYQSRWKELGSRPSRPRGTVVLRETVVDDLLADIAAFMQSEEWYCAHGVPYRRGYLFYGLPGCGKSSLITSLAGEVQAAIYIVNLSNKDITDEKLLTLVANAAKHSFLLLEDVDRAWAADSKITFSGLLNAIDGAAGQEGKMLFMTTNHYDALDPALVRPGRVDRTVHIPAASPGQARGLYLNFFPQDAAGARGAPVLELADAFAAGLARLLDAYPGTNVSVAELQGLLLQHKHDAAAAARSLAAYVPIQQQQSLRLRTREHPAAFDKTSERPADAEQPPGAGKNSGLPVGSTQAPPPQGAAAANSNGLVHRKPHAAGDGH